MRLPAAVAGLLALAACRSDPLAVATAVPRPIPPAPTVAQPGVVIAVDVTAFSLRGRGTVSHAGTIDVPLCPGLPVAGLAAPAVCDVVAQCLARQLRTAAIRVAVGDNPERAADHSGCVAKGPPHESGWTPLSSQLLALAPRVADIDPHVFIQAAEAASTMETMLVARTAEHPRVQAQRLRLERLLAVSPDTRGESGARRLVDNALLEARGRAEQERLLLGEHYGDAHPRMRTLATQIRFLTELRDALPSSADRDDGIALELDAVEAHATEPGASAAPPPPATDGCAARLRAYDLRIARRRGQRSTGAADPTLEHVIDALAIARAVLANAPQCRSVGALTEGRDERPPRASKH